MNVVVIGSGLAAVGAIRALIKSGHRPIVLDIGERLSSPSQQRQELMSTREPSQWTNAEWQIFTGDESSGRELPRKLVFGSDYFYSKEEVRLRSWEREFPGSPPWSPARGGFSVGWGAAALPPASTDIEDWPVSHEEILAHMRQALIGVPVSEPDDELGDVFGRLRPEGSEVLSLSSGQKRLLERLRRSSFSSEAERLVVGQSRLLTQAGTSSVHRCRMCGHCSSGCVYGSIYSAEHDIDRWEAEGEIDYRGGVTVFRLGESSDVPWVDYLVGGRSERIEADLVFLAAGAVNSTRVLMNSSPRDIESVSIRRTSGSVQLYATATPLEFSWPEVNTQTSHFLSYRSDAMSRYWSHVQIGQPNEPLLRRIGLRYENSSTAAGRARKLFARHLVTAIQNLHSDHGPVYRIRIERNEMGIPLMFTSQTWTSESERLVAEFGTNLSRRLRRAGLIRLPLARVDSRTGTSFHIGASFPMSKRPSAIHHTDLLGRPFGWQRVHVVDTSVLPAIPATTVGLLTMANAHRIASNAA